MVAFHIVVTNWNTYFKVWDIVLKFVVQVYVKQMLSTVVTITISDFDIVKESLLKRCVETIPEGNLLIGFGGRIQWLFYRASCAKSRCGYWLMFRGSDANLCKWNFENFHYNKYALEKCDKVFALSREIADNIKLVAPNKTNIVVIPNYTERISKANKDPPIRITFILDVEHFHLNEKKGISLLMRMVAS